MCSSKVDLLTDLWATQVPRKLIGQWEYQSPSEERIALDLFEPMILSVQLSHCLKELRYTKDWDSPAQHFSKPKPVLKYFWCPRASMMRTNHLASPHCPSKLTLKLTNFDFLAALNSWCPFLLIDHVLFKYVSMVYGKNWLYSPKAKCYRLSNLP